MAVDPRRQAEMDAAAERFGRSSVRYQEALAIAYGATPRIRYGRALSLNTVNRTVRVQLEEWPPWGQVLVDAHWGRERWTESQIVGKRVRVWWGWMPEPLPFARPWPAMEPSISDVLGETNF